MLVQPPSLPDPGQLPHGLRVALALLAAATAVRWAGLDTPLFLALHAWGPAAPTAWSTLSLVGTGIAALLLCLAAGPRCAGLAATCLLVVVGGGLVVQLAKALADTGRPLAVLGADLVHPIGLPLFTRAMPSGHSACAFALAALWSCWPAAPGSRRWPGRAPLAFAMAAAIALSRVAVGAHWPSDTLAGAALGLVTALLVMRAAPAQRLLLALATAMTGRAGSRVTAAAIVALASALSVAPVELPDAKPAEALLIGVALAGALAWWRHWRGPARLRTALRLRRLRAGA